MSRVDNQAATEAASPETTPSVDAKHRPVGRPRKEQHSGDTPTRDVPSILMPHTGPVVREAEDIVLPEAETRNDYLADLAFMEEVMTIRLERTAEKNAPRWHAFYVNGRPEWVPVGVPWKLKRKYVEVIARAQPYDVQTEVVEIMGQDPQNKIVRDARVKYPFSVVHDPNPAGPDWLAKILMTS